jgi:predicted transcriptional regulator
MELHLRPDLESKLSRMAAEQGRPTTTLVEEAIERLVDYDDWFVQRVEEGIAAADRGDLIEHADVRKMIESRLPSR